MSLPRPIKFTTRAVPQTGRSADSTGPSGSTRPIVTDPLIAKIDSLINALQTANVIESPIATRFVEQLVKWRTSTILEFGILHRKAPARIFDFITFPVVDGKRVTKFAYYDFSSTSTANGKMTIPLSRDGIDANKIIKLVATKLGIPVQMMQPIDVPVSRSVASASSRAKFINAITTHRASILDRVYDTVRSLFTSYGDAIEVDGGVRPSKEQLSTWTSNAFVAVRIPVDLQTKCSPHVRLAATFTPVPPTDHGIGKLRHTLWNLGKEVPKFARETGNKRAAAIASANAENLKKLDALTTLYDRATDSQNTFKQLETSIGESFSYIHPGIGNWNASGMTNDDATRTLTGVLEIYKKDVDEIVKYLPRTVQVAAIRSVAAAAAAPRPPPPPPPSTPSAAPPPPPPPQPNRVTTINQQVTTARVANAADASAVSKNNERIKKYQDELVRAQRRIQELERNVELRNAKIRKSSQNAKEHRSQTLKKLNTLQDLLDEGGRIMKTFKAKITDQKAELRRIGALLVSEYAKNEKLESRILKRDRKIRRLEMTLKSFVLAGVLAASVPFFMSRNSRAYPTVKSRGNASTKKLLAQIQTLPPPSYRTRVNAPRISAPRTSVPRINVPRISAPSVPRINAPRINAPRINVPRIKANDTANAMYDPSIVHVAGLAAAALGIKSMISKRLRRARNIRRERMNEHVPTKNEMTAWNRRERMNETTPNYPASTYEQLRRMYGDQFTKWRA
jgi:hypothetical protein